MPPWRRRSRQTVSLPPCSTLLSVACPALRSGISFPYNRSGYALSVKRRPSLLDGILLPRAHRSAAPPIPILLPNRQHTRVLRDHEKSNNPALALNVLLEAHLAAAANHVFVGSQLAQSHRAPRMEAIGRDAGFGAEAEFEAVGEARRCVYVDRGGVDLTLETPRGGGVLRNDRVGQPGAVARNKTDRFVEGFDDFDRQCQVEVLGVPIFIRRRFRRWDECARAIIAAEFHAGGREAGRHPRQKFLHDAGMHDHRLHRVAYGGPAALRVEAYLLGHREIGCAVDVDVTDAVEMREDWNGGACERCLQLLAAAWDDQCECFRMTLEDLNRLAIRVADEHHRIRIEIGFFQ